MITIRPVERDGQHYVELTMDGQPMEPHGPWSNINEAEAVAYQLAGICRGVFHQPVFIGGRLLAPTEPRMAAARKR